MTDQVLRECQMSDCYIFECSLLLLFILQLRVINLKVYKNIQWYPVYVAALLLHMINLLLRHAGNHGASVMKDKEHQKYSAYSINIFIVNRSNKINVYINWVYCKHIFQLKVYSNKINVNTS